MPLEDQIPELRQEHRDLLMLLRAAVNGRAPAAAPERWEKVLDIARLHQVDMFLYSSIAGWPTELQPEPELMARWRNAFFKAVAKYAQAAAQLKEILQALHEANVPVIPLKGAWLAENIYPDGACRPMCDFDLLVPLEKLDAARAAFEALDYTTPDHYMSTERDKDVHYRHPDRPMMVELHFRIWHEGKTNVVAPDTDRLWMDPVLDQLHGIPVLTFPPERQLVYLAQHILHHALTIPLRAYLDLILLIRKNSFNAEVLDAEAKALGLPFGAKFITQIALDLGGIEPTDGLARFATEAEPCAASTAPANTPPQTPAGSIGPTTKPGAEGPPPRHIPPRDGHTQKHRLMAFRSILELSIGSSLIKPEIADSREATLATRLKIGFGVVFKPPGFIRSAYPEAIRKGGLIGGYWARFRDVAKRSKPVREKAQSEDASLNDDFENFDTRRALSEWIHQRDQQEADRS